MPFSSVRKQEFKIFGLKKNPSNICKNNFSLKSFFFGQVNSIISFNNPFIKRTASLKSLEIWVGGSKAISEGVGVILNAR